MVDLIWHLKVPFHFKEPSEIDKNMTKKEVHLGMPLRVYLKAHLRVCPHQKKTAQINLLTSKSIK